MELLVIGGDMRYAYLAKQARECGMEAGALGLRGAKLRGMLIAPIEAINHAESVLMPNPFVKGLQTPLDDITVNLEDVFTRLPRGARLFLGGSEGMPDAICEKYSVTDLWLDEQYQTDNAYLTAEGAISAAMNHASFALSGTEAMIVGYGRIGKALHAYLSGLRVEVTVAARRESVRTQAALLGAKTCNMEEMETLLPRMRAIYSTPPERVLGANQLRRVSRDTLVIDLSSPPFGVDLEEGKQLGLMVWREPGLPGRYCPETAGAFLFNAVKRAMKERKAV